MARTRQRHTQEYQGSLTIATTTNYYGWTEVERCVDVIGNVKGQNPLTLTKAKRVFAPTLTKTIGPYKFVNRHPSCSYNFSQDDTFYDPLSYNRSVLEAISDSHPGEPTISIPNFLYELRELPNMFRHYAKIVKRAKSGKPPTGKDGANEWLAYNFGWKPLYNDLRSLYNVAEGVKRQARRYAKAKALGHISTRGKRGKAQKAYTKNGVVFDVAGLGSSSTQSVEVEGESWTTAWWQASDNLPLYALLQGGHRNLLLDQLGLDVSFQTIWNMIPWSWLVDWCTDASSLINIYSNRGGFKFLSAVMMEHVTQMHTYTPARNNPHTWTDPVGISYESKRRTVVTPSLADVGMNIFTAHQMSILAALVIGRNYGLARR